VKHTVKRLRKALKMLFPGITGEPLPHIKGQWETAFTLAADKQNLLETMPDTTRELFERLF
jgi:hypothetical protein